MKLALLFTRNISLRTWDKGGSLARETLLYKKLSHHIETIYFFTYGGTSELAYRQGLPKNIQIVPKPWYVPSFLYVFLMPIVHRNVFRTVDIIKTNQMDGSWAGVIAKKLFGKKLIVRSGYEWLNFLKTTHASFLKRIIARVIESWSYAHADRIVITSKEDRRFIETTFNTPSEKISVIRNFIDTDHFKPDEHVQKEKGRIVFVGRLEAEKNIHLIIQAMKGLHAHLILIGHGSLEENIKEQTEALHVPVTFMGRVSQEKLPRELQKSELFILPSSSEGNPKALLEAMACGLPALGTNVKGIKEILENEKTGLLAEINITTLREKITLLLESRELRDRLGSEARQHIMREYSLPTILEQELTLYTSL